ncbi:MAG: cell division protein FtsW [Chloroflexi bacterium]|nr:cell division protein FtsW [Chloroflexota bacterium]MBI3341191.1 cell division protein FtsW [Chloroflexota bacterium]
MSDRSLAKRPASKQGGPLRGMDAPLLMTVITLVMFGLIMLYSASWDYSRTQYDSPTYMFVRQLMWLGIGIVTAFLLSHFDYHHWRRLIVPIMGLTIILLITVLLMKEMRLGAKRSLYQGSYQPSELAKLVTILYLSVWLYAKRQLLHDISLGLIPLGVILGVVGGLIYQQPDLSAATTVFIIGGLLFFLAGGDLKQIFGLLAIALVAGWLVVQVSPTGQQRVTDFVAGLKNLTDASYHVQRSFAAIVNGGWFGVSIGRGQAKFTGLPVPPTDSIFAVIVEELGFIGAVFLIGLYAMLVWRGLVIARRAPDMLGTLLATGLVFWIGIEAAINMAVMVGLLPFAGNALPFISAGGSNLVSSLAAIGILINISRQQGETATKEEEWRAYSAAIDLRGWNRRRRVSRPRRTPGIERFTG